MSEQRSLFAEDEWPDILPPAPTKQWDLKQPTVTPKDFFASFTKAERKWTLEAIVCAIFNRDRGLEPRQGDLDFIRSLALKASGRWTPAMHHAAWRMLRRYGPELSAASIPLPEEPPVAPPQAKPIKRIGIEGTCFFVTFTFHPDIYQAMRQAFDPLPTALKNDKVWCFRLPLTAPYAEKLVELSSQYSFETSPEFTNKVLELLSHLDPLLARSRAIAPTNWQDIPGFGLALYPFQQAGVQYALDAGSCIIGDEMGLGKTRQLLAVWAAANAFPAVLICPALVKGNWLKEASLAFPQKKVVVLNSRDPIPADSDLVIVNFDILADRRVGKKVYRGQLDSLMQMQPVAVGIDEIHKLRNCDAKRTQACEDLTHSPSVKMVHGLTGTLFVNRPRDAVATLRVIRRLDDVFGDQRAFINRYCAPRKIGGRIDTSGAANLGELNMKLRRACYVRRTKSEVLKDLPPKQRAVVPVALSPEGRKNYDEAEADLIRWMEEQEEKLKAIQAGRYQLQPGEEMPKARNVQAAYFAEQLVRISVLRQLAAIGKMQAVKEWVGDFLESGEKLVVFAWHKSVVEKLSQEFKAPVITGDVSPVKRTALVEQFQEDPNLKLLVLNIEAGGVGITLTAASNVCFIERPWTPADEDQCLDRCHRIGQTDSVTGYFLDGERTIDFDMARVVESKRAVVVAATDGGESAVVGAQREVIARIRKRGFA